MAFPTTGVLDNFTGTDGTDLPVYSSNWSTPTDSGACEIQGNAATSVSGFGTSIWNVGDFGPGAEVHFKLDTVTTDSNASAGWVNGQGTGAESTIDGYMILVRGNDQVEIHRLDNFSFTQLGADFTQTTAAGDSVGLESLSDGTLTAYYKAGAGSWTALGTRSDATYTGSAGRIGISSNATPRLDDFGGGTIVAAGGGSARSRFLPSLGVA